MHAFKTRSFAFLALFLFTTSFLYGQIPKLISYQGILTDNNSLVLADGNYTITVKIFDALTGGNELWSEDHSIALVSGLFNIALGSNTDLDLPFNQPYYISTTVDGTELLPRSAITASPYALNANGSGSGGKINALDSQDGSITDVVFVDNQGQVGIGALPSAAPDAFTNVNGPTTGRIGLQSTQVFTPNEINAIGVYGQSSPFGSEEDTDFGKGIQGTVFGENTFQHTGIFGRATASPEGFGVIGIANNNDISTGVRGIARDGTRNIGIYGLTLGGDEDFSIFGENSSETGWAGFFKGNGYFGKGTPTSDNNDAQLYVEGGSNGVGVLSSSSGTGGSFIGGQIGLRASSSTPNGTAGTFDGYVNIEDNDNDTGGLFLTSITTGLRDQALYLANFFDSPNGENTSLYAQGFGINGVGGYLYGDKLGARLEGNLGLEVKGSGSSSAQFFGPIDVFDNSTTLPTIPRGSNLRASGLFVVNNEDHASPTRTNARAGDIELLGASDFSPIIKFQKSLGVNGGSLLLTGDVFSLESANRIGISSLKDIVLASTNGMTLRSRTPNTFGVAIEAGTQGLSIDLLTNANENTAFILFQDAGGIEGRIKGQTSIADVGAALQSDISIFIDNLFSPGNYQGVTGQSPSTSAVIDPFSTTQNETWSNNSNASNNLSSANSKTYSTFISNQLSPELVIETVILSVEAIKSVISFASSFASVLDPEDIFSTGYDLFVSTFSLVSFLTHAADQTIGVAYESGAGDYAEWLLRADTAEVIRRGEIVGVRAGEISTSFIEADHFMAVSTAPAVIGKMPQMGDDKYYEMVAFMGQVPVRVAGEVQKGDYIIPSGKGDGFGIAIHPKKMRALDYHRIVGIAWEASDGIDPYKLINVAVGINQNDLADMVNQMQNVMNDMQLAIQEVNPNYQPKLFETVHPGQQVASPSYQNYTVAPTHQSQVASLFGGKTYASSEEAIAAVTTAWKEVA
ncbi:MAG: hypothetical protein AAF242_11155, partial [Bacteroidota bacterium]